MKLNDPRVRTWLVGCATIGIAGWFFGPVDLGSFGEISAAEKVLRVAVVIVVLFGPLALLLGGIIMVALSFLHAASGFLLHWLYASKPLTLWQAVEMWQRRRRSAPLDHEVTPLRPPASE